MPPRVVIRWAPKADTGWGPIAHFVGLAQRLLSADVELIQKRSFAPFRWARRTLFRPSICNGKKIVIYFAHRPNEVLSITADPLFDQPAAMRIIWIIDSFWTERLSTRLLSNFDLVVFMQKAEAGYYHRASNGRSLFIGWGTDALELGSNRAMRKFDLLRVGRQPPSWDNDNETAIAAKNKGLVFHGRPPAELSYNDLTNYYSSAKFIVAFSNIVSPSYYTHPSKAYFTGRWTDALAGGAVVAGIAPKEDAGIAEDLWDGALLDFSIIDLEENLAYLKKAAAEWTPDVAQRNYKNALLRLDWRWRLKALEDRLDLSFPELHRDLEKIHNVVFRLERSSFI